MTTQRMNFAMRRAPAIRHKTLTEENSYFMTMDYLIRQKPLLMKLNIKMLGLDFLLIQCLRKTTLEAGIGLDIRTLIF